MIILSAPIALHRSRTCCFARFAASSRFDSLFSDSPRFAFGIAFNDSAPMYRSNRVAVTST
ncbi:hypothetical protein NX905_28370 [Burkholderia thailandensis]|nr:hypothetical protein [Burkholderia thailandensis]MCS6498134.1 hypothetical protein [Burkholderia thailandensis]MCS6514652.1 hypothetical protein [Burkholderia thailandensis]MCS6520625.1 hypothetical protein [Burkholderia thailandensis]